MLVSRLREFVDSVDNALNLSKIRLSIRVSSFIINNRGVSSSYIFLFIHSTSSSFP